MSRLFLLFTVFAVFCTIGTPSPLAAAALEDSLHTRVLTESELLGLSADEFDLLRNHIYGRHGYIFKRADLKKHFSGKNWYKASVADPAAVEKKLNIFEKQNVTLLKKLEAATGKGTTGVSAKTSSASAATSGEFIDDESNIRSEPSVKGKLLGVSKTGESFDVLDAKDPWYYISTAGGITGWTHKKNIKLSICGPASIEHVETPNSPEEAQMNNDNQPDADSDPGPRERISVEIDLDLDKTPEKVELEAYESTAGEEIEETYYRLKVSRRKGSEWEPLWTDEKNEHPFYIGHAGVEFLQVVQDIDVDGKVEILSACAQSDVSPTLFRLFRWDGTRFSLVRKALLVGNQETPTEFVWTDSKDDNSHIKCWVLFVEETDSGSGINGFVTSTFKDQYKSGKALLRHSAKGFTIEKWIEPLKEQ